MGSHDIALQFLREGQRHQFAEPPNALAAEKAYRSATLTVPEWGENHPLLDDEKLVSAYLEHLETKDDELFWAWQHLHSYISSEPRRAWEITLKLIEAAKHSALVYIATGPLEDILYSRAEVFVDDVERLARTDPKFLSTLRLVSGPFTREFDASNRIQRAAGVPIRFIDDDWPSCDPKGGGGGGQT